MSDQQVVWDGEGLELNADWPDVSRKEWLVPKFELPDGVTTEMRWVPGHAIRRNRSSGSDYGVAGMSMLWVMKGPAGTVTFELMTLWTPEMEPTPFNGVKLREYPTLGTAPIGGPVTLHMLPGSEQSPIDPEQGLCDVVDGGFCLIDATYTAGTTILQRFIMSGDPDAIWWSLLPWYSEIVVRAENRKKGLEA
jgi:hypothetical protein